MWRQRRRNTILLLAIAVAVGGVIILNSLIRGMQIQMVETVVDNLTGHIKIHAPGYRDDPSIENGFSVDMQHIENSLSNLPIKGWATRLNTNAVVMSERETRGAQLVGVDPTQEQISFLSYVQMEGQRLADADDATLVMGRALVEELRTKLGRRVVITTLNAEGLAQEIGFRIIGIFEADSESLEKGFMFTGRRALQEMLGTNEVTEISVRFAGRNSDQDYFGHVESAFEPLAVMNWQEVNPMVAFMYQTVDIVIVVWLGIVLGALVFGLVNTLITAVLERTQEFGLFRAVGMRAKIIVSQVVTESLLLMVAGIALGLVVSFAFLLWLGNGIDLSSFAEGTELMSMSPTIKPIALPRDVAIVVIVSIMLAFVASFYPAQRAARMNPLEAMRD